MYKSYQKIALQALKVLVPFASANLCESSFLICVHIKTKQRNKLNVEDEIRLALSQTQARISKLVAQLQVQQLFY